MSAVNVGALVRDTLQANSLASNGPQLAKAFLQPTSPTSGLQSYDLEAPAKLLYPVLTPLRNIIPRVSGKGGTQANWKAITAINPSNIGAGLGQGNRGGVIDQTVKDYLAAYRGLGLDNYVTYEADFAAEGFQDVKATAVQSLLRSLMIAEEAVILNGNGSNPLGVTPTPTVTLLNTGGTIGTGLTVQVGCVALTAEGRLKSSILGGIPTLVVRPNADGSTDTYGGGSAAPSAIATVTTTTGTAAITADVAPVIGAAAYAWFVGTGGNQYLAALTYINSVAIKALPPNSNQAFSTITTDNSVNGLIFNGIMQIAATAGSGAYYAAMPTGVDGVGTGLTADGTGGVVEIDAVLQSFWDNYRLSPSTMWVSSQEQNFFRKKVLATPNAATSLTRFTIQTSQDRIVGGSSVRGYINPFGMGEAQEIPIKHHPNMTPGTILFTTDTLPYALNGVTNLMQIKTRRDYYQIEWPLRSRKYEYGVYTDEVLQHYFPPSLGVLCNIAPG